MNMRKELSIKERLNSPTPKFWKKVQKICIALGVIGAAIAASPVALPVGVITAGGYLIAVGSTGAALSQLTINK